MENKNFDALMNEALSGVRVIDISNFLAGPISSMFLGDYGADVIKVERPDTGDEIRFWGNNKDGVGLMYKLVNRNKRSVTADLRTPLGVEIVKELSAHAAFKSRGVRQRRKPKEIVGPCGM